MVAQLQALRAQQNKHAYYRISLEGTMVLEFFCSVARSMLHLFDSSELSRPSDIFIAQQTYSDCFPALLYSSHIFCFYLALFNLALC